MRVIAGSAKRIQLKTIEGLDTRPTTDRIKETLFNMISEYLADSNFLDLFSGSGGIGIEALSRGAAHAAFVEQSKKAMNCIRDNLHATKLADRADLYETDVINALSRMEHSQKFDYIFMDPPYNQLLEKKVLEYLSTSNLLSDDALIIVEASLETDFSYVEELGFSVVKEKLYKTNKHIFLEREAKSLC
ncbi:MAG: 16S rRNA (guanine(966)-N(2))-methyltransferase RsmD [Tyzzerella sp.]|nr:16S rRNA (guanine(966)-N(2))-methyltransferase RsmD [Tyzzerella sp.]